MATGNIIKRSYEVTLKTNLAVRSDETIFYNGRLSKYMDEDRFGFATGAGIELPMTHMTGIFLQGSYSL